MIPWGIYSQIQHPLSLNPLIGTRKTAFKQRGKKEETLGRAAEEDPSIMMDSSVIDVMFIQWNHKCKGSWEHIELPDISLPASTRRKGWKEGLWRVPQFLQGFKEGGVLVVSPSLAICYKVKWPTERKTFSNGSPKNHRGLDKGSVVGGARCH